ncbi:DUF1003 domain-containing protein [Ramlibacter alkalitolerans]|jgi:uncharacterized membrane protein|uniref:DUF1003 domain-containing protein n=1 Tax=Ramlibacter alkalitolerans TaxID=2039631 RepID=A0ABS1JV47_9BURK|nr:DUF1003 domain-containing protein [Ramlibacter alkalitolerans]MBL0428072.1 DUF1003 domain-containing protein [Ramlibacter alkalitolerans]
MSESPSRDPAGDIARRNVRTVRELEALAVADPSFADKAASFVARFCGSIYFVLAHALLFGGWIVFNSIPGLPHFDPFPFTLLTMFGSLEAIFLTSFILIAQNYTMRVSERRSQLELQVNLLAEQEATKTLQLLEEIARTVGASKGHDPEVAALAKATRLDTLAREIDQTQKDEDAAEAPR